ncbi:unnamed protein product, partial [Polarella glacialis]
FKVHSVIAGAFGLGLLFIPDVVGQKMAPGRVISAEERLALQSWAAFMLLAAGVAKAAATFPPLSQLAVARVFAVSMSICTIVWAKAFFIDLANKPDEYRASVAATGLLFFGIAMAYILGIRAARKAR